MSKNNIKVGENAYMDPSLSVIYLRHAAGKVSSNDFKFDKKGQLIGKVKRIFNGKMANGKETTFFEIERPFYSLPLFVLWAECVAATELKAERILANITATDANVWKNLESMRLFMSQIKGAAPTTALTAYNELSTRYTARQSAIKSSNVFTVVRNTYDDVKAWAQGAWNAFIDKVRINGIGDIGIGALPILAVPVMYFAGAAIAAGVIYKSITWWVDKMRESDLDNVRASAEYQKLIKSYPGAEKDVQKVTDNAYDAGVKEGKEQANDSWFGGKIGNMLLPLVIVGGGFLLLSNKSKK